MNKANWLFRKVIIYLITAICLFALAPMFDSIVRETMEFLSIISMFIFYFYAGSLYNETENKK